MATPRSAQRAAQTAQRIDADYDLGAHSRRLRDPPLWTDARECHVPEIGEEHVSAAVGDHTCFKVAAVLSRGAVETIPIGPTRCEAAGGLEFSNAIAMQKSTRPVFVLRRD
jgi:hypothetical protein